MNKKLLILVPVFTTATLFAQPTSYTVDSTSLAGIQLEGGMTQVRFADVNQDGHLDIVSIGDHGSPNINTNEHGVTVFLGNGTGTGFQLVQNGNFGYGGCAVGDINNDGKQDIAYGLHHNSSSGDFGNQLIEAALGNGTGASWTPWDDGLATNGESYGMFGTDLGDINNDGWLDIASNSFGLGPGFHVYKNLGTGNWQQTYSFGYGGTTGKYIQFGDFDGDGNLDLVASNESGSTFFGNGLGGFTLKKNGLPPLPDPNQNPYGDVSLGDIDNDGDDDFVFTFDNSTAGTRGVYVYKWNKNTQSWDNASTGLPSSTTDYFTVARLADMDMDGFLDVVTDNYYGQTIRIYKGNGGTSWTNNISIVVPGLGGCQDIAIADINHTGYPDILVWGSFSDNAPFFPQAENKLRLLKDVTIVHGISATLNYPKGNECWPNYAVRIITWTSAVMNNNTSTVKIEYSTTGNAGPWTVIAANAPNNGIYQWNVPAAANSSNCFIRVTATDNVSSTSASSMNSVPFSMGCNTSTTGVNEHNEFAVEVFPNPFTNSVTVFAEATEASIRLIDIAGNVVQEFSNVSSFPFVIERSNMPAGVYMMELRENGKEPVRVKLITE